jgi:hypothetical protein
VRFLLLALLLAGCTSMHRMEDVAVRSYELGCLDYSVGSREANLICYSSAEKFRSEVHNAWAEGR